MQARLLNFLGRVVERIALNIWLSGGYKMIAERSSTIRNIHHTCSLKMQSLFERLILGLDYNLRERLGKFQKEKDSIEVNN